MQYTILSLFFYNIFKYLKNKYIISYFFKFTFNSKLYFTLLQQLKNISSLHNFETTCVKITNKATVTRTIHFFCQTYIHVYSLSLERSLYISSFNNTYSNRKRKQVMEQITSNVFKTLSNQGL